MLFSVLSEQVKALTAQESSLVFTVCDEPLSFGEERNSSRVDTKRNGNRKAARSVQVTRHLWKCKLTLGLVTVLCGVAKTLAVICENTSLGQMSPYLQGCRLCPHLHKTISLVSPTACPSWWPVLGWVSRSLPGPLCLSTFNQLFPWAAHFIPFFSCSSDIH